MALRHALIVAAAFASLPLAGPLFARSTPTGVADPHTHRLITFKVQLDESHAVVDCTFDSSSSLIGAQDPEYPHMTFRPDAGYIDRACRQIRTQQFLYLPRNVQGGIDPLYLKCDLDVETNEATC